MLERFRVKDRASNGAPAGAIARDVEIASRHDSAELAANYEQVSSRQFENGKLLVSMLEVARGENVLDIGAGTGRLAAHVAATVGPRGRVVAIDPLAARVQIARRKAKKNLEARVGRAENLSAFADESFGVVYLNSVFHWVEDKPRALAEISRVLRPGGRLGINCQHPGRPNDIRVFVLRAMAETAIAFDPYAVYPANGLSETELSELMTAAGFVACRSSVLTFVDVFPDMDELWAWASSSTFGNFLLDLPSADRLHVREALGLALEAKRTPQGIRLERHLAFATARKPGGLIEQ